METKLKITNLTGIKEVEKVLHSNLQSEINFLSSKGDFISSLEIPLPHSK